MRHSLSSLLLVLALPVLVLWTPCPLWANETISLMHHLEIRLDPHGRLLQAQDLLVLPGDASALGGTLELALAPQARLNAVTVDGREASHRFDKGRLAIDLPDDAGGKTLLLQYGAVFDQEPEVTGNMDNPGFGVSGLIRPEGAMLLAGSGWHPWSLRQGVTDAWRITVRAPTGMLAVSTGKLIEFKEMDGETISVWEDSSASPLPLAAGRWQVKERLAGDVRVMTLFTAATADLAPRYLEASAKWLEFYAKLHGPYAFPQFLVVENFLPTGYGFPGFTLLGGEVLRLPFIPDTSLRHEIAHCWWGNGVGVDMRRGNWCEGLTTYVADYLSEEEKSPADARDYRQRNLRRYALLAAGGEDFPLREFRSRNSPASQAVGYGKAMHVFHMIRRRLGDEAFWASLRRIYQDRLFQDASWEDFRDVFVGVGGWDKAEAEGFLTQWLDRPGAPYLRLENTTGRPDADKGGGGGGGGGGGWRVEADLRQRQPVYASRWEVRLELADGAQQVEVQLPGETARVEFAAASPPSALAVDPDAHVFRLLHADEIPATVDTIKGSTSLVAVLGASLAKAMPGPDGMALLGRMLESLSQEAALRVEESGISEKQLADLQGRDILFLGQPATPAGKALLGELPMGVSLDAAGFRWPAKADMAQADALFLAMPARSGEGARAARGARGLLAVQPSIQPQALARAATLLTHYGRFSHLAFAGGRNTHKGTWPPGDGPLAHRFAVK